MKAPKDGVCVVRAIRDRRQDLFASIGRVGGAMYESSTLQASDDAGDGARRDSGQRRERAAGHRPAFAQQIVTLEIRGTESHALGEGMVKQHRGGAQSPHVAADDAADQLVAFPRLNQETSSIFA